MKNKKLIIIVSTITLAIILGVSIVLFLNNNSDNSSKEENNSIPTPTPSATIEPTMTPEPTSTPEPTETPSPTPTVTPTQTPKATSKSTQTQTPKATSTPKASSTPKPTPAPAPTPTPTPVASVPKGTWSSNGWTVVSNGDGTGTASVRGITRNIKIEKDMNCDTCYLVINTSTSRGNLLAIGNPKGYTWRSDKDIGMINTANNTLNNVPELRDLSEIERDYRVTINGISIPNRQINNESDDTLVEYYHLGNDITYKRWDIIDDNFNYAGMIVLKGTPNTEIITDAARDHNWEQIYVN